MSYRLWYDNPAKLYHKLPVFIKVLRFLEAVLLRREIEDGLTVFSRCDLVEESSDIERRLEKELEEHM